MCMRRSMPAKDPPFDGAPGPVSARLEPGTGPGAFLPAFLQLMNLPKNGRSFQPTAILTSEDNGLRGCQRIRAGGTKRGRRSRPVFSLSAIGRLS